MIKITKHILQDILRNRIVLAYTVLLLGVSVTVFSLEDNAQKGMLSLLNLILFIVPLVSIIFSTIYIYNCSEFIEMLLSQPLRRRTIWFSFFAGLAAAFSLAFFIGAGVPLLIYANTSTGITMLMMGILLSVVFVAIALLASVYTRDKAKGIGLSILLWLYFSLVFDSLVLFMLFQFADYPLEKAMVAVTMLNPIALGRILILLRMDISALMGYTGAIFKDFFGTTNGYFISIIIMILWIIAPFLLSLRKFNRKDI